MNSLGIDFGVTKTSVAFFSDTQKGHVAIHSFLYGYHYEPENFFDTVEAPFPSAVFFDRQGDPKFFGEAALEAAQDAPHLLVDKLAYLVGKTYEEVKIDPRLHCVPFEILEGDLTFGNGAPALKFGDKQNPQTYTSESLTRFVRTSSDFEAYAAIRKTTQGLPLIRVGETKKQVYLPEQIVQMILEHALALGQQYVYRRGNVQSDPSFRITVAYPDEFKPNQVAALQMAMRSIYSFTATDAQLVSEACASAVLVVPELEVHGLLQFREIMDSEAFGLRNVLVVNIEQQRANFVLVKMKVTKDPATLRPIVTEIATTAVSTDYAVSEDIDSKIVDLAIDYANRNNLNLDLLSRAGRKKLSANAQDAREALMENRCDECRLVIPGYTIPGLILTKSDLQRLLEPIQRRHRSLIDSLLETNNIHDEDFSRVILTDSISRIDQNLIVEQLQAPTFTCPKCKKRLFGQMVDSDFLEKIAILACQRKLLPFLGRKLGGIRTSYLTNLKAANAASKRLSI